MTDHRRVDTHFALYLHGWGELRIFLQQTPRCILVGMWNGTFLFVRLWGMCHDTSKCTCWRVVQREGTVVLLPLLLLLLLLLLLTANTATTTVATTAVLLPLLLIPPQVVKRNTTRSGQRANEASNM